MSGDLNWLNGFVVNTAPMLFHGLHAIMKAKPNTLGTPVCIRICRLDRAQPRREKNTDLSCVLCDRLQAGLHEQSTFLNHLNKSSGWN